MKAEFVRPASVRGWCRAKALIKITYDSTVWGRLTAFWLESPAPDSVAEAAEFNRVMQEIETKLQ